MAYIDTFLADGVVNFGNILEKEKCGEIYSQILSTRKWDQSLFRSQEEVVKDPHFFKTNPGKGKNNLAEKLDLSFVENNAILVEYIESILGKDYDIVLKNFVCAVPNSWVPKWLRPIVKDKIAANLGSYIKEEYRDLTYFRGLEYHLDSIDHRKEIGNHLTVYVYLNDVGLGMSPLHIVEKSYIYGATTFPHCVKNVAERTLEYGSNDDDCRELPWKVFTGKAGSTFAWSSFTLHGTPSQTSETARISLRYDIKPSPLNENSNIFMNEFLKQVTGHLSYSSKTNPHRADVEDSGNEIGNRYQKIFS